MLEILELRVICLNVKMQVRASGHIDDVLEESVCSHKSHALSGDIADIDVSIEVHRINPWDCTFEYLGNGFRTSQVITPFTRKAGNGLHSLKVKAYLLVLKL